MGGVHPLRTLSPRVVRGSNAGRGEKSYRGCRGDRRGNQARTAEGFDGGVHPLRRAFPRVVGGGNTGRREKRYRGSGGDGRGGEAGTGDGIDGGGTQTRK